jgi:hypothetical protein
MKAYSEIFNGCYSPIQGVSRWNCPRKKPAFIFYSIFLIINLELHKIVLPLRSDFRKAFQFYLNKR